MREAERTFLERARVGTLTTVDEEGRPHPVPICYALLEDEGEGEGEEPRLVSAIDDKPKSTRELRRVRNVRSNPRVAVLVDRYREDWSRLAWVQLRGRARVVQPGPDGARHEAAVDALQAKYAQYADHDLRDRPIVEIDIETMRSWGALDERD